ncbi:MAG: hypothetical protein LBT63_03060 [Holosporaceae bacterium]|jgi:glucose-6-phosphate isomerase|nr:hypothetical protein [Holosporaceae bacterium]
MLFDQKILSPKEIPEQPFNFWSEIKDLDCFSIVNAKKNLEFSENPRLKKWTTHRNFLIFGTGGSCLGGQCIRSISPSAATNVKFVNNLDPSTLRREFSEVNPKETGFLCISKSGETLETIVQTLLAIDFIESFENPEDKFVVLTENKPSSLMEIAKCFNLLCLEHPSNIGGRFSVFSAVGTLPAILCGINPGEILEGGRKVLNNFEHSIEGIEKGSRFVANQFFGGFSQHVSFIYADKLLCFGAWLAQLYGESTGKSGRGITPLTAVGSVDQHSQLQLYLDGKRDKCFTFFLEKQKSELKASGEFLPKNFAYLGGKKVGDIFEAQCAATVASILEKGAGLRKIEIPAITPKILGALFMHFMLEVVCVCKLTDVNPFDQPAVERGKIIAREMLKRQK